MKTLKENLPKLVLATLLASSVCSGLSAQTNTNGNGSSMSRTSSSGVDTSFIGKNMRDNKMEIDLSQLALDRSSNQHVKRAAQQMVTDHTRILNDLAKIAQNNNMQAIAGYPTDGGALGTADAENNGTGTDNVGGGGRAGSGSGSGTSGSTGGSANTNNSGNVGGFNGQANGNRSSKSQSARGGKNGSRNTGSYNNLGTTSTATSTGNNGGDSHMAQGMEALQNASGAAFDKLWIPQMLNMHEAKLAELTNAINTINDSDLKTAITQAIPKIRMHRDMLSGMNNSKASK